MINLRVDVPQGLVDRFRRESIQRIERAALVAADKAAKGAHQQIRAEMQGQGIGRLGQALGVLTDKDETGRVHRRGPEEFSASGMIFIRSKSPRTVGAIISYTEGASIRPVKGRWLWIPSDDIQRLVGSGRSRQRLTPALWSSSGLDSKIGPLHLVRSVNGNPLLVVNNVGVSLAGKRGSARRLNKNGQPAKGQIGKSFVVAFIGIPFTARTLRVDPLAVAKRWAGLVPDFFKEELQKG